MSKEDDIKLCDFALASYIDYEEQEADCIGSLAYMSPEIMIAYRNSDINITIGSYLKNDIW